MYIETVPPIARSNFVEQERRLAAARAALIGLPDEILQIKNKFESFHPTYAIKEDLLILQQAGCNAYLLSMVCGAQPEFDSILSDEMKKAFVYDYHETFLRMLNSVDASSSHWLLKAPVHLLYLDILLQRYPNAALIMTHRSIKDVLPSFCHLKFNIENMFLNKVNTSSAREMITAQYVQLFDKMLECPVKFRTQQPKKNVFDVKYDDLMEQPIGVVRRIYDHFGLQWSEEFETAMQCWLRDNPQGKQCLHTYSPADCGLTHEDIERRYADYKNLFLRSSCSDGIEGGQLSSTSKSSEGV